MPKTTVSMCSIVTERKIQPALPFFLSGITQNNDLILIVNSLLKITALFIFNKFHFQRIYF